MPTQRLPLLLRSRAFVKYPTGLSSSPVIWRDWLCGRSTFVSGWERQISALMTGLSSALSSQLATLGTPAPWKHPEAFASCREGFGPGGQQAFRRPEAGDTVVYTLCSRGSHASRSRSLPGADAEDWGWGAGYGHGLPSPTGHHPNGLTLSRPKPTASQTHPLSVPFAYRTAGLLPLRQGGTICVTGISQLRPQPQRGRWCSPLAFSCLVSVLPPSFFLPNWNRPSPKVARGER